MRARVGFALLVVALLLIPIVPASHNMGHRYLVFGRLLDSNGMPVQNQDVEIRLMKGSAYQSSIITRTDCLGDFDSWRGREGPPGAAQEGEGEIEGPLPIPGSQNQQYVNFHFHDPALSSQFDFELRVGNETWREGFNSRTRQTVVARELGTPFPTACGGYDQFNSTFQVRVYIAHVNEMKYTIEPTFKSRAVTVSHDGGSINGTTNFIYTYVGNFNNTTIEGGDRLRIEATDLGAESETVSDEEAKFHRVNSIHVIGGPGGVSLSDFRFLGIFLLVAAIAVGLYYASKRVKTKREEARLREGSTRRRFRKERGGPGNPP